MWGKVPALAFCMYRFLLCSILYYDFILFDFGICILNLISGSVFVEKNRPGTRLVGDTLVLKKSWEEEDSKGRKTSTEKT